MIYLEGMGVVSLARYIVLEVVLDWWGSMKLLRGWLPRRMIRDDLQGCGGGDVFQKPNSAIAARYLVYIFKIEL